MLHPPEHEHCHLTKIKQKYLPIFLCLNYDSHFIIKQLRCNSHTIDIIPNSSEKYFIFSEHTTNGHFKVCWYISILK